MLTLRVETLSAISHSVNVHCFKHFETHHGAHATTISLITNTGYQVGIIGPLRRIPLMVVRLQAPSPAIVPSLGKVISAVVLVVVVVVFHERIVQ